MNAKTDLLARSLLRPGCFDGQAEAWAKRIPHDEPGDFAEFLRDRVANGSAQLADMVTDGQRVGFCVYAVVDLTGEQELVVIAAFGRAPARDLTAEFLPQIEVLARSEGCVSIRFHTMRPGLVSKAIRAGCRVSEVIIRKTVSL